MQYFLDVMQFHVSRGDNHKRNKPVKTSRPTCYLMRCACKQSPESDPLTNTSSILLTIRKHWHVSSSCKWNQSCVVTQFNLIEICNLLLYTFTPLPKHEQCATFVHLSTSL